MPETGMESRIRAANSDAGFTLRNISVLLAINAAQKIWPS